MEKAIRAVRKNAVKNLYDSLLFDGWGNSTITICDVDKSVDLTQFDVEDPEHNVYIVCDGAHRIAALSEVQRLNPNIMQDFKVPCSYIGKLSYDDRITYAFGNIY